MATAITVVLLQFASLRLPSSKVMAYTYLTPTWVIGWEVALGNGVPPVLVLGSALLLRGADGAGAGPVVEGGGVGRARPPTPFRGASPPG